MKLDILITHVANILFEKLKAKLESYLETVVFENKIVWLTSKEAADYLKISENNLRAKVSRGQIPVHGRLGKSWRFRRDKLDELLNSPERGVFND